MLRRLKGITFKIKRRYQQISNVNVNRHFQEKYVNIEFDIEGRLVLSSSSAQVALLINLYNIYMMAAFRARERHR